MRKIFGFPIYLLRPLTYLGPLTIPIVGWTAIPYWAYRHHWRTKDYEGKPFSGNDLLLYDFPLSPAFVLYTMGTVFCIIMLIFEKFPQSPQWKPEPEWVVYWAINQVVSFISWILYIQWENWSEECDKKYGQQQEFIP